MALALVTVQMPNLQGSVGMLGLVRIQKVTGLIVRAIIDHNNFF